MFATIFIVFLILVYIDWSDAMKYHQEIHVVASMITIIGIVFVAYQFLISKKTLEITSAPQVSVYPETIIYPSYETRFDILNGKANMVLKNNSLNSIGGLEIYAEGVALIQNKQTKDIWICGQIGPKWYPIATSTTLDSNDRVRFFVKPELYLSRLVPYYEKYRDRLRNYIFIRLRARYYRVVDKQPGSSEFYFVTWGNNGITEALTPYPDSEIGRELTFYTKEGVFLSQDEMTKMIHNYLQDDPRCYEDYIAKHPF